MLWDHRSPVGKRADLMCKEVYSWALAESVEPRREESRHKEKFKMD